MSKKANKRRSAGRGAAKHASARVEPRQAPARFEARPAAKAAESAPAVRPADIAEEYRYVYGDLKRMGILVISLVGVLVVLALLAQYLF